MKTSGGGRERIHWLLVDSGFPSQRPVMQSFDVFFWSAPEQTVGQTVKMPVITQWYIATLSTYLIGCNYSHMTVTAYQMIQHIAQHQYGKVTWLSPPRYPHFIPTSYEQYHKTWWNFSKVYPIKGQSFCLQYAKYISLYVHISILLVHHMFKSWNGMLCMSFYIDYLWVLSAFKKAYLA